METKNQGDPAAIDSFVVIEGWSVVGLEREMLVLQGKKLFGSLCYHVTTLELSCEDLVNGHKGNHYSLLIKLF